MLKNLLMIGALSALTASAFADDAARAQAENVIALKDGSTVFVFKGGKMAMEDKYGRAVRMEEGKVMETKDGQKIIMHGDEVSRLSSLLKENHTGGS
jgi:hypothetical protein